MKCRFLCIDWGEKRVGVALSDPSGTIAQPLLVLNNDSFLVDNLKRLCKEKDVKKIVLGLPIRTDGKENVFVSAVEKLAKRLKEETGIEVVLWDERFSSAEAFRYMDIAGERKRRQLKDKIEASVILQSYLESLGS